MHCKSIAVTRGLNRKIAISSTVIMTLEECYPCHTGILNTLVLHEY